MAPDGERISRKTSLVKSGAPAYPDANNIEPSKPANKALAPKQSRQADSAMPLDGKSPSSSSLANMAPLYSLSTTKAVKPANKTVAPKQALQINLQQRQRHQQQLQQIRSIHRKRTVAFAVNHEKKLSEPHAACVVSADAAPGGDNSSSAQSLSTRDTEACPGASPLPTVTCDSTFLSRASPSIRDSCTFQKRSSGFGEENPENETNTSRRREKEFLRRSNAETAGQISSSATEKNNQPKSRLVVDVRCAEEAAVAISNETTEATSSSGDVYRSAPVPVTPTCFATNSSEICPEERSLKKQKVSPNHERREAEVSGPNPTTSELTSKLSKKSKIKRVRYDMERVPLVEINQDIWGDYSGRFRKQSQPNRSSLRRQSPRENKIDDNSKSLVQRNSFLQRSVLWIPSSREEWEDCISEMKGICTSAAFRRWSKIIMNEYQKSMCNFHYNNNNRIGQAATPQHTPTSSQQQSNTATKPFYPPLSQAFIKDRVRIDDPLKGYQIRHATGGWLQGFLTWTNFTVWTLDFQWDSNHPASGLLEQDREVGAYTHAHDDGALSKELQALPRGEQDPLDGGTVLKQIAEISLLGGLGCGELLLRKAIEDIRNSKTSDNLKYKFIVLQATEGSRRFYEKMGFVRVGAVCRYRWAKYCSDGNSSGKKPDITKVEAMEVDSKFHGYRHWTYTNESSKSLNAHGGPSVMMCLKLDNYNEDNRQSVSELLQPHLVTEKPTIQVFGNVSNPDSENLVRTRKSQRRSSGTGGFKVSETEEQDEKDKIENTFNRELQAGEVIPDTTRRRTSNRSKRGQNSSLANSCYVLYGVESGRNSSNTSEISTPIAKKSKRKQASTKDSPKSTLGEKKAPKKNAKQIVELPSAVVKLGNSSTDEGMASASVQWNDKPPAATKTIFKGDPENSCNPKKSLTKTLSSSPPITKILSICNKENIKNNGAAIVSHLVDKSSRKRKVTQLVSAEGLSDCKMKPETEKVTLTTAGENRSMIEQQKSRISQNMLIARKVPTQREPEVSHPPLMSRKRSRRSIAKVIASKLLKQKVDKKSASSDDFYNQVVIRRDVQYGHEQSNDDRNTKHRRDNFRWCYNGGLMIDHRYEFCYYFVLNYNEAKKTMTIVPMIKDGVFEQTKGNNNNNVEERLLGRPRYQCNILETDKNWIRDVPLAEYAIVPDAVPVFETSLVAQEAWDIGGKNCIGPRSII